ncbi:MAG: gliding motility-associated ABC transporter permease subunit GldF [Bacteroidetes bacterium]|nr:MAG: gliding motility-associated ABC transporter permease subunit GldF [Bacteroidota bacterium]
MWAICKKELRQFFTSLTGYLAIIVFLLLNGLFLFVFPDSSIFDFGYATLDKFFELAPWILLLLIPAITMRSFSDEFRSGTYEILLTRPLSKTQIILGKYVAALIVVVVALIPTLFYVFTIKDLSTGGIDSGGIAGSYVGLIFLAATFTAIGICSSSFTANPVVSFLLSAFLCFLFYNAFSAVSKIPTLKSGTDYYVEMLGIDFHYQSISRGVLDSRDLIYFLSLIFFFLFVTDKNLEKR